MQGEIRAAGPEDLAEIVAMMADCPGAPQWPSDAWPNFIEQDEGDWRQGVLFVLRGPEGDLWGWIAGSQQDEVAELEFLLVHPGRRGLGLGKRLVSHWLNWARCRKAQIALLEVRASNAVALRLYGSLGFVDVGRRRRYYRAPVEDAVQMSTRLQSGA